MTGSPKDFITPVPHLSFVTGEQGRSYMRARHAALAAQPLFEGWSTPRMPRNSPSGSR